MSAETLSLIAGAVLTLVFSYVPGLSEKFAALDSTNKRLIMLAVLATSAAAIYGLGCVGWALPFGFEVSCDVAGIQALIRSFILAAVANQGLYTLSPETARVRAVKANRV